MVGNVISQLSNREIALLIWLAISIAWLVIYTPTRRALGPVLKLLFFSRVTIVLLLILTYVAAAVYAFDVTGLWRWWMLKDTLFWFFGVAMPSLINLNKATEEEH